MFWCNEGSYKELKCFNSAASLETSVSFDNFGIVKNPPEFLLKYLRLNLPKNIIIGHLNINSIRNKFVLLKEIVAEEIVAIFVMIIIIVVILLHSEPLPFQDSQHLVPKSWVNNSKVFHLRKSVC